MRRTLTGELTIWLVASISIIVIGLSAGFIWRTYHKLLEETNQRVAVICHDLATILREPLWNVRADRVAEIVDIYMGSGAVDGVRVWTDADIVCSRRPQNRIEVVEFEEEVFHNNKSLGWVKVSILKERIYVRLNRLAALVCIVGVAIIMVVILMTRLIMNRLLQQPLSLLVRQLEMIAEGRYFRPTLNIKQSDIRAILEQVNVIAEKIDGQQSAIRKSENKYRNIVESSPIGISQTTEDGSFIMINPAIARMFGYDHPQQMRTEISGVIQLHVDSCRRTELLEKLRKDGRVLDFEAQLKRRQGDVIWASLNLRAVRDPKDDAITIIEGFVQDISARKAAEENLKAAHDRLEEIVKARTAELSESNARLWALLGASPDPITIYGVKGEIDYINPAFTETFGWRIEELKDKTVQFVPEAHLEETRQAIKRMFSGQAIAQFETCRLTKAGKMLHVAISASVFPDYRNPAGSVVILRNITDRKLAEEELMRAKEAAEAAALAKSNFLANMSHEIRTPLNGVIAAASYVISLPMPEEVEKFIKIIYASGHSLVGIIDDILDFSKIEAQKVKLDPQPFHLVHDVIMEIMGVMRYKALEKQIELGFDIDPAVPKQLIGDPLRIKQVLNNLVGNAIKFTDDNGFVFIDMQALRVDADSVTLLCSVTDNGGGIDPLKLPELFQPFTQADNSIRRKYGGAGLGLSISKRLIRLMDGWLWAASKIGRGSTFYFTACVERQGVSQEPLPDIPANIRGLRALIVDDRPESALIIKHLLDGFGYHTEIACSGMNAVARLKLGGYPCASASNRSVDFDLIIMDWRMPQPDGLQTAQIIRQELQLDIPIIITSTLERDYQNREKESDVRINGFMPKPVNESVLLNAILSVFGQAQSRHETSAFSSRIQILKQRLAGMKALLVEDNETNREIAVAILTSANVRVVTAENGNVAVELLQKDSAAFDVVLMDIQMPIMDGLAATRKIRDQLGLHDLPIIAMTAHAMDGDREKCLAAGMNAYVSKPINQEILFGALWKIWKNTRTQAVPANHQESSAQPEFLPENGGEKIPLLPPGLDLRQASGLTGLPPLTIARILQGFAASQTSLPHKLRDAWQNGDGETLRRLAHSLKGAAGNIGALELAAIAKDLEAAAQGQTPAEDLLYQLNAALNQTLAAIAHYMQLHPTPASSPLPNLVPLQNSEQLQSILEKLAHSLQNADPVSAEAELTQLKQSCPPDELSKLDQLIQAYKYDAAVDAVEQLAKRLGIARTA